MKIKLAYMFIAIIVVSTFAGCKTQNIASINSKTSKISFVDLLGRHVELDSTIKRVVAIGPGALRLYCYVGNIENVVGIEQIEKEKPIGRPYILANPSLMDLPVIGPGGPNNSPDAESLLAVEPDVIFTTYAADPSLADKLQEKTGIPVVALSYGKVSTFDPNVYTSIKLIGEIIGDKKRAEEVLKFIKECEKDLMDRTKDIPENEKPKTYVGAVNMKGAHGIESTQGNYALFDAVNAINVVDETGKTGSLMIDKEKLMAWNPDKIFIDYGGIQIVKEDYKKNSEFYQTLSAFENEQIYGLLPYNYYTTNIDTAMVDAYFIGKTLFSEAFKEIDPVKKADDIYKFLLGRALYEQMSKDFGELGKIEIK